jgi:5'-nucleotidase
MKILITNDDGYKAKGLRTLANILRPYGDLTVVAPKEHQSGMSMAVNLGQSPIPVKKLDEKPGERWWYLGGTPSSCVKYGIDNIFYPEKPDVVVSGINHGGNYGTAYLYSGTIGAAAEAALAYIPTVAVSLDAFAPDADFSAIEAIFPLIFEKILAGRSAENGFIYNVNFPNIPKEKIRGIRMAKEAWLRWENEFVPYNEEVFRRLAKEKLGRDLPAFPPAEAGEERFMMAGDIVNDSAGDPLADINLLAQGYVTVTCHRLINHDLAENARLRETIETDY